MNPKLSEYINQAKVGGMTENQIRDELVKAGWPALEVEEALAKSRPIHPDRIKIKSSNFLRNFIIVFFVLLILAGAVYGFWYVDRKIKNEGPKTSLENQTTTGFQEFPTSSAEETSSASSSQPEEGLPEDIIPSSSPTSTKLAAIPAGYQLKEAYFSSNGEKVLWIAEKGALKFIFLNESASEGYAAVSNCQFNSTGSHISCIATKNKKKIVILDDKEGNQYDSLIKNLVFSPDGEKSAFLAATGTTKLLVLNGQETPFPYDSAGKLVFSSDGSYLAYIATKGTDKFLVVNGKEIKIEGEVYSDPVFNSDNKRVGYGVKLNGELLWKEAEAE